MAGGGVGGGSGQGGAFPQNNNNLGAPGSQFSRGSGVGNSGNLSNPSNMAPLMNAQQQQNVQQQQQQNVQQQQQNAQQQQQQDNAQQQPVFNLKNAPPGGVGGGGGGRGNTGNPLNTFPNALANALPNASLPNSQLPFAGNLQMPGGSDFLGPASALNLMMQQQQQAAMPLEQQMLERAGAAHFAPDGGRLGMGHRRRQQQQRNLYDFFPSEQLRQDLVTRGAQSALMLGPGDPRLHNTPNTVQDYHTLFPLDANLNDHELGSLGCASTKVYKAVSRVDGSTVVLRRLEAAKVTQHFDAVRKAWMDVVHPNIVRLRNIFISNEWDKGMSNSLTFVHDFIFGAMTLQERFMRPGADMGDLSEDLVWSYIAQVPILLPLCEGVLLGCIVVPCVLGALVCWSLVLWLHTLRVLSVGGAARLLPCGEALPLVVTLLCCVSLFLVYWWGQLSSALRYIHSRNKALRCVNAAKILVTAQHRLYVNGSGSTLLPPLLTLRPPPLTTLWQ